jgi:hypothetical protein
MLARALYWLLEFVVLLCAWWLFTGTVGWNETVAGAGAALLGATATEAVRGVEHPRFLPDLRWIADFRHVPGAILKDSLLVTGKLWRMLFAGDRSTGRFVSVPFPPTGSGARSIARRVLAILYTTLPPNTIVIGIDRAHNGMLMHQLEETS